MIAAAGLATLAIAACGSSGTTTTTKPAATSSTPASSAASAAPLVRAALASAAAPGERLGYALTEDDPSLGDITITGTGAFDNSPVEGQLAVRVMLPSSSSSSEQLGIAGSFLSRLVLHLDVSGQTVYLQVPASFAPLLASYTDGRGWVSLDLAKLAGTRFAGIAALLGGQSGLTDPLESLEQVATFAAGDVTRVRSATIDGVATTQYRATVQLSQLKRLAAERGASAQAKLAQLESAGIARVTYDVYIDDAGLVRRVDFALSPRIEGTTTSVTAQIDFLAYGHQATPRLPAAGDTTDLTSLLGDLG